MRYSTAILALGAALVSGPALAQLNTGLGAGAEVNAGAQVDAGGVLGPVTGTLDRAVGAADRTVNGALAGGLRLATAADVRTGAEVRDSRGRCIGTVQALHGDMALVVHGDRAFHVPLAALYRGSKGLVTSLTQAQLQAGASAQADAHAHGTAGH